MDMQVLERYELVVGLEVHAQLNTRTKLFCGCAVEFGGPPNTRTCPVCLGHPGVLPVVNEAAFDKVLAIALAFGCDIEPATEFDRKNYYYPDLPKNYQISQNYHNLGTGGELLLVRTGKKVRMHNVHLEEDAGKLVHPEGGTREATFVDLNRAGTPLAEIVSQPDLRSVEDVDDYMRTLTRLLVALDASNAQMQEGNLRFEASVSVRPRGETKLYKRVEIKNLNSYAAVKGAVAWEHARQIACALAGKVVAQETRLWDGEDELAWAESVSEAEVRALLPAGFRGRTALMRSKENAHDYRYFPEPDLLPFEVTAERRERLRRALPELPGATMQRLRALGVPADTAEVFVDDRALGLYFERVHALGVPAPDACNYVRNQVATLLNERGLDAARCPVPPEHVAELHEVISMGLATKDVALKRVWPTTVTEGLAPKAVVAKYDLAPLQDEGAVRTACEEAWAKNPRIVADLLKGKDKARGGLVGPVMKATRGKAPPELVNRLFDELLAAERAKQG